MINVTIGLSGLHFEPCRENFLPGPECIDRFYAQRN